MKKTTKAKEPVKIRFKELNNGNKSVYLDIYHNGKRQYKFLKLYIVPEKTPLDKLQNQNVMVIANKEKSETILKLTSKQYGIINNEKKTLFEVINSFFEYDKANCRNPKKLKERLNAVISHLDKYDNILQRKIHTITDNDILQFVEYLKTTIKESTAKIYYITIKSVFSYAVQQNILAFSPFAKIGKAPFKTEKKQLPVYIEHSELQKLIENKPPETKKTKDIYNAFLFSCYSGLRWSDIVKLTPENIKTDKAGQKIITIQTQKTQTFITFPLPQKALFYMQSNYENTEGKIFRLPALNTANEYLKKWEKVAGINKHLHFHIARHTFATLAISAGVPVEVVKELLGHSDISTTLIYAEVTTEKKQREIEKMNNFL